MCVCVCETMYRVRIDRPAVFYRYLFFPSSPQPLCCELYYAIKPFFYEPQNQAHKPSRSRRLSMLNL